MTNTNQGNAIFIKLRRKIEKWTGGIDAKLDIRFPDD